ncbi:MAG: RNA polymerase sigma factor [Candidatus Eisenbacteria bacterium]
MQADAATPSIEVPETFEDWYLRERPRLVAALNALCGGNRVEAAEIADETCARTLERWDRVQRMESPGGWAYRVALNLLRRRARRARQETVVLRVAAPAGAAASPDWSVETREAIAALPPAERTAVVLRYVADLTQADIARAMHVSPGTVASTLHAARGKLARSLEEPHTPSVEEVPHG